MVGQREVRLQVEAKIQQSRQEREGNLKFHLQQKQGEYQGAISWIPRKKSNVIVDSQNVLS